MPIATDLNLTIFFAVLAVFGAIMFFAIGPMWKAMMGSFQPPGGLSQEAWIVILRVFFGMYTAKTFMMALTSLFDGA